MPFSKLVVTFVGENSGDPEGVTGVSAVGERCLFFHFGPPGRGDFNVSLSFKGDGGFDILVTFNCCTCLFDVY